MFYLSRDVLHDYKTTSEINDFNRSIILFEIPTRQPTCVHFRLTLWCAVFTLQCVISLLHSCLGSALTSCVKVFRCIPRASGWQVSHIHFSRLTSATVCLHVCARRHCTPPACFGLCSQERSAVTQPAHTPVCVCESLQAFCLCVCGVQNKCVQAPFSWLAAWSEKTVRLFLVPESVLSDKKPNQN